MTCCDGPPRAVDGGNLLASWDFFRHPRVGVLRKWMCGAAVGARFPRYRQSRSGMDVAPDVVCSHQRARLMPDRRNMSEKKQGTLVPTRGTSDPFALLRGRRLRHSPCCGRREAGRGCHRSRHVHRSGEARRLHRCATAETRTVGSGRPRHRVSRRDRWNDAWKLGASPAVGQGATFTVRLPIAAGTSEGQAAVRA